MSNEINIEELERLAKAAAPGPWRRQDFQSGGHMNGVDDSDGDVVCASYGRLRPKSFDFIAAANPSTILSLIDRLKNAESELERERMRLTACGVVAMADTPESAAKAREMRDEYRSASCDDVARRVDECMTLRAERDALTRDAERYRWIRGGSWIGVKWCELYSGGAALDEAIDSTMKALPSTTAKARFDKAGGYEEPDPIERLRFFCSKAMSGQDWFDVEQFFDEVIAERDTLAARLAELEGQEPVAWMTANREMTSFVNFHDDDLPLYARPISAEPVNARLLDALRECRDRFFPADQKERDRDQQWGAVNGAIAAAEPAPKAGRLTDAEVAWPMEWQPIESAPPNEILLLSCEFDGPGDWRIKCGYRDDENGCGWKVWGSSWTPTRWMKMPPAPGYSVMARNGIEVAE